MAQGNHNPKGVERMRYLSKLGNLKRWPPEVEAERRRKMSEAQRARFREKRMSRVPAIRGALVVTSSYHTYQLVKLSMPHSDVRLVNCADAIRGFKPEEWIIEYHEPLPADLADIEDYIRVSHNPFAASNPAQETE